MGEQIATEALIKRYGSLAADLDGFADASELMTYVLEATADDLERTLADGAEGKEPTNDGTGTDGAAEREFDDDAVATRLEDLGYIE